MNRWMINLGLGTVLLFTLCVAMPRSASAQACPHQFLFSIGDSYFYSAKLCATGQILGVIFVYPTVVETGCGPNNGCNTTLSTLTVLNEPQLVGDPPGAVAANVGFKRVPPEAPLLTEFGRSPVSVWSGYPKFVRAQIDGTDRYFKLFRASHTPTGGQRMEIGFGVEVTSLPQGVQTIDAANVEKISKRVKLTVPLDGQQLKFEALYELVDQTQRQ